MPRDDEPDVTRFKSAAAKRVQTHRARARMGLRCLTVRVNDRQVRCLISNGYLSLESSETAAAVAIALEAWIYDNLTINSRLSHHLLHLYARPRAQSRQPTSHVGRRQE